MKPLQILGMMIWVTLFGNICGFAQNQGNEQQKTFYTADGKLFDAKGNEFIIRGINNPHYWFLKKSNRALNKIAKVNSNTIRLVWQTNGSANNLRKILKKVVKLNMIAIPELHDFTGKDEIAGLETAAKYWSNPYIKAVLDEFKPYIIINIANEWMDRWDDQHWFDGYKSAVQIIRNAGLTHCLLIDGAGWGQDINPIKNYGKQLIELDPLHNLLFDIHMYGAWNDTEKVKFELNFIHENKIPLIVGEFGYNWNDGKNNLGCKADASTILVTCQKLGIGYMPWSWCGNNAENAWLDIVKDWGKPTAWGELVINSTNGIKNTAKCCSIFNGNRNTK